MAAREIRELDQDGHLKRSVEAARPARLEELRGPLAPRSRPTESMQEQRGGGQRWREQTPNGNGNGSAPPPIRDQGRRPAPANGTATVGWYDRDLANGLPEAMQAETNMARIGPPDSAQAPAERKRRVIYPMGISRARLEQVIGELGIPALVGYDEREADAVLVLKSVARKQPDRVASVRAMGKPLYILRTGTVDRLREAMVDLFGAYPTTPQS